MGGNRHNFIFLVITILLAERIDTYHVHKTEQSVNIRFRREKTHHITLDLKEFPLSDATSTGFKTVRIANSEDHNICTRTDNYLIGFRFDKTSEQWVETYKEKISESPLGKKFQWWVADLQNEGNDVVIIRTPKQLIIFKPSLRKVIARVNAYTHLDEKQEMIIAPFYPDPDRTGIFSKMQGSGVIFEAFSDISDDLEENDEIIDELQGVDVTESWVKISVHEISNEDRKLTFVLQNTSTVHFEQFYEPEKEVYRLKLIRKLTLEPGRIFFANFTNSKEKDLLVLNDDGLFIYQWNEKYTLLTRNSYFSKINGWRDSHSDTFQVVGDLIIFSGPMGLGILTYRNQRWDNILDLDKRLYSEFISLNDKIIFTQETSGKILWGEIKPSNKTLKPLVPTPLEPEIDLLNFDERGTPTEEKTRKAPLVKRDLPWVQRWPYNFVKDAAEPVSGGVKFLVPFVNVTISPNLNIDVTALYDSTEDSTTLLGQNWVINLAEEYITVDHQQSIYPSDHVYYLYSLGEVLTLKYLRKEDNVLLYEAGGNTLKYNGESWEYEKNGKKFVYGKCGDTDATHWSLTWENWRGSGTDVKSVTSNPIAWHLCLIEGAKKSINYEFLADYEDIGDKKITVNLRVTKITSGDVSVELFYEEKTDYKKFPTYNEGVYNFPTPLLNKYRLNRVLLETENYKQDLKIEYTKNTLTSIKQNEKTIFSFEYKNIGNHVVLSKASHRGLTTEFDYEIHQEAVVFPKQTDWDMYPDMLMATASDYIIKAYRNYLKNNELIIDVLNTVGTQELDHFRVNATLEILTFQIRALKNHIIAIVETEEGSEINKYSRVNGTWAKTPDRDFLKPNSTINIHEGILFYTSTVDPGATVTEWDGSKWNTSVIETPKFAKALLDNKRLLGYAPNQLSLIYKDVEWKVKNYETNWELKGCEILNRFNYTADATRDICQNINQTEFQLFRNIIALTKVEIVENRITFKGLLLMLDTNYDVKLKEEVVFYTEDLLEMTVKRDFSDLKNGTIHFGHKETDNKFHIVVKDITGEAMEGVKDKEKEIKELTEKSGDSLLENSLIPWEKITVMLSSQGVHLSEENIYRITGTGFSNGTLKTTNEKTMDDFILKSDDSWKFSLLKSESGYVRLIKKINLLRPGMLLNNYPEYIAYRDNVTDGTQIMTFREGKLKEYFLYQEEFLYSSSHISVMTIVNKTSMEHGTSQALRIRPISTLSPKLTKPLISSVKTNQRVIKYEREFETTETSQIKQKTRIIPGGDKSLAGYVEVKTVVDVFSQNTKQTTKFFNNNSEQVHSPKKEEESENEEPDPKGLLKDKTGTIIITDFNPYSVENDEGDYIGFENYESPGKWKYDQNDVITNEKTFTGSNILRLRGKTLQRTFEPKDRKVAYVLSTWVRAQPEINQPTKIVSATFEKETEVITLYGEAKNVFGEWTHIELKIDFDLLSVDKVHFKIRDVDVDHVSISPLSIEFSAFVYNSDLIQTAVISNGRVTRALHNRLGQRFGSVNENGQIDDLLTFGENFEVIIKPGEGFFETFDAVAFTKRWVATDGGWETGPAQLLHTSNDAHTISARSAVYSVDSTAIRFEYSLRGSSILTVYWGNDNIKLQQGANISDFSIPTSAEFLAIKDKARLTLYINGGLVFDEPMAHTWSSDLNLEASGQVLIENMVIMKNPMLEIQYKNEWGENTQTIRKKSENSALIEEILYDNLGRGDIITKQTEIHSTGKLFHYHEDFAILEKDKILGKVTELNSEDKGYPYVRKIFARNPLNEPIALGLPGAEYSTDGAFVKKFSAISDLDVINVLFPVSYGFRHKTTVEPNQSKFVEVVDRNNNRVALYIHVPGFDPILSTYEFDEKNNLVKILPPEYHKAANTTVKVGMYQTTDIDPLQEKYGTFFQYDEKGNVVSKKTPDADTVEYLYTDQNLLRFLFIMDKNNKTKKLIYFDYDTKGRLIGSGSSDQSLARDQLKEYINKDITEKAKLNEIKYDDKVQTVVTHVGDETLVEKLAFNSDGELQEKSVVQLTNATRFGGPINMTKTFRGKKLHSLSYPVTINGKQLTLVHEYNTAGQMIGLGLPGHRFVTFKYSGNGAVVEEKYSGSFKRTYEYDSPGYLLSINDPFLEQKFTYTQGGYGQDGFGDGMVMSSNFKAKWTEEANQNSFRITEHDQCLNYLKKTGHIRENGQVGKSFVPAEIIDVPVTCTGSKLYRLAMTAAERQKPLSYGHCYAYGNHQELVKAKYFTGETCSSPLQPGTFSKETSLSLSQSHEVFQLLADANFLKVDQIQLNVSYAVGTTGDSLLKDDEIEAILDKHGQKSLLFMLKKFIMSKVGSYEEVSKEEFINKVLIWTASEFETKDWTTTAEEIFNDLQSKEAIPSGDPLTCLNSKFLETLKDYKEHLKEIVRVLHEHQTNSLGSSPFDVTSYDIDANGNHHKFHVKFQYYTLDYHDGTNKVKSVKLKSVFQEEETYAFEHDSNGHVIQAMHLGIVDISYHPVTQRTQAITMADGRRIFFAYDSYGERIQKRVVNKQGDVISEVNYLRDEKGRILVDRSVQYLREPVEVVTAYIYGPRGLLGFIRNDKLYTVTTDQTGSVRLVIKDGQVLVAYDYLPYGQHMRVYGEDVLSHIRIRYTEQEYDEETGLYNFHARLYDPTIGRFYQKDPKNQYFSPYKYAGNSPLSLIDPDGQEAITITMAVIGLIVGAYLAAASVNDSWNPAEWRWNAATFIAIFIGALTGAFLGSGAWASVLAFKGAWVAGAAILGLSGKGALIFGITMTTVLGLGGAYWLAAAKQGTNPAQWKWSRPEIWNAMFEGLALGSGIVNTAIEIKQIGKEMAKLSLKGGNLLKTFAKPLFWGSSFIGALGMSYYKAASYNGDNFKFWEWDWTALKTYTGLLAGFAGGFSKPKSGISFKRWIGSQLKNAKGLFDEVRQVWNFAKMLANEENDNDMTMYGNEDYLPGRYRRSVDAGSFFLRDLLRKTINMAYVAQEQGFQFSAHTKMTLDRWARQLSENFDWFSVQSQTKDGIYPPEIWHLNDFIETAAVKFRDSKTIHVEGNQNFLDCKEKTDNIHSCIPRRRVSSRIRDATSSGSKPEFWLKSLFTSIYNTVQIMFETKPLPKRTINKLAQQEEFRAKTGHYFSVLDMGDQWLAETNFHGNMLWLMILVKKITGINPYVDRTGGRIIAPEMGLLASQVTYDFAENVTETARCCGIGAQTVEKVLSEINFATVAKSVYGKLIRGELDEVGGVLFKELLAHKGAIARITTDKQANRLIDFMLNKF